MNKIRNMLLLLIAVSYLSMSPDSEAQTPLPLPNDVIVTVDRYNGEQQTTYILVRVDANTFAVTDFYVDEIGRDVTGGSWSPRGDILAIERHSNAQEADMCFLSREGILQNCFPDKAAYVCCDGTIIPNRLSWSADGSYVYRINKDGDTLKLVEINIRTGDIERVLYSYPFSDEYPVAISWTDDLAYALVATGYSSEQITLIDLATGEESDVIHQVVSQTLSDWEVCYGFSPHSHYIVIYGDGFIVMDVQGSVIATVEPMSAHCPVWQADEKAFYFSGNPDTKHAIYKFSLATNELELYQELSFRPSGGLYLSPDETHFALFSPDRVRAGILYPDGGVLWLAGDYRASYSPIWVLPLSND